ncbi:Bromo adjacent homology (BAH) domain-containing protein [Artemisia annua]|uniref:Bromo adjacent homology (BAH) domain-containing protein n=1 Tax=Artemisia annua TaxID=35608 RepID=A0A2U1LE96_ARTAN|nr:Bromo adjacent homology (BAH) domain-containing protein [Artemisia annua]
MECKCFYTRPPLGELRHCIKYNVCNSHTVYKNVILSEGSFNEILSGKIVQPITHISGSATALHQWDWEYDSWEDSVLVTPPDENHLEMKPSVAIIKDIYETLDGSINVTGQKFYRPELTFNQNGENLEPFESRRLLYYSFDKCEFPADSVMHKCRVHYLEPDKNIPSPKQHPGFIVRKVYNSISNKLNELLDSGFEEWKRREISLLVQRTSQIIN